MTNETTASQQKSIGDDAQFLKLLDNANHSFGTGDKHMAAEKALVAYIDSRAPAAQASATIQAAPEEVHQWRMRTPTNDASWHDAPKFWAYERVDGNYEARTLYRAATIQEPVMVAEPVGDHFKQATYSLLAHVREVLFDGLGYGAHQTSEKTKLDDLIRKAVASPMGASLLSDMIGAAPMVADPAGVAGLELSDEGIVKVLASFGIDSTESKYGFDALQVATTVPSIRRVVETYLAATVKAVPSEALDADDVQWVVNDNAELGVKIGNQFFFLYKGSSLVYEDCKHDNGEPMMWRPVFKREFGECAHPINHADYSKIGTVSLGDSDEWKPLDFAAPLADKTEGAA